MSIPGSLSRLIENLSKMPGIGPKTAQRLAFYIMRSPKSYAHSLVQSIADVKNTITFCQDCNNLSEDRLCVICSDE